MQNIRLICIGKLKEPYLREAFAEYEKRLRAFCRFTLIELPEERLPDNPSAAQIEKALAAEGDRILAQAQGSSVFAFCIEGTLLSSEELAQKIQKAALSPEGSVSFVIGSSYGLSEKVTKAAAQRISVSRMTFPHQLFRVMACEQIYRAFQIISGGKYHK